jgi:regulatory protein
MTSVKKNSRRREDELPGVDPRDLERIAIGLLARREHSRAELVRKLTARGFAPADIEPLLDLLSTQRLQSDVRYAEAYVSARSGRGYGPQRIRAELRERGIAAELIEQAFAAQPAADTPRIDEIWRRKFAGRLPADYHERARQMRFLQQRGFSLTDIHALFGRLGSGDE